MSDTEVQDNGPAITRTLTKAQADVVAHYQGYGVPVQWFIGQTFDDGRTEVIALGSYSPGDVDDPRQFVWSFLISSDGQDVHTSEGQIPEGFSTGIDI